MSVTTARMSCPARKRAAGWGTRAMEMFSSGMREVKPHPRSTKAPKLSRWVTRAGITSPGALCSRSHAMACSWARRRERTGRGLPPPSTERSVMVKQVGFPTRERTAMSRSAPLTAGWTASRRGITPSCPPKRTKRSRRPSQRTARPSSTVWWSMASRSWSRVSRSWERGRAPSGKYSFLRKRYTVLSFLFDRTVYAPWSLTVERSR